MRERKNKLKSAIPPRGRGIFPWAFAIADGGGSIFPRHESKAGQV
jgi:hypothetical protein